MALGVEIPPLPSQVSQFSELYAIPAMLFVGLYAVGSYFGVVDWGNDTWRVSRPETTGTLNLKQDHIGFNP